MIKSVQEVFVADDAAEDALVVAEKNEGELAGDCYGGAEFKAATVPVEMGGVKHRGRGLVTSTGIEWRDATRAMEVMGYAKKTGVPCAPGPCIYTYIFIPHRSLPGSYHPNRRSMLDLTPTSQKMVSRQNRRYHKLPARIIDGVIAGQGLLKRLWRMIKTQWYRWKPCRAIGGVVWSRRYARLG